MNKKNMLGNSLLLLTALVWGSSFVAQAVGGVLGTFSFNGIRSFVGSIALMVLIVSMRVITKKKTPNDKTLLLGGICCGVVLFASSTLQQLGMNLGVSSGKAGFMTALYIVMVPIIHIFMKKKVNTSIWISVVVAVIGLYMLCLGGDAAFDITDPIGSFAASFSFGGGEIALLLCAIGYAVHIVVIDHFAPRVDCVKMSCLQFFVVGVLSLPMIAFVEKPSIENVALQWLPLAYSGIMSCGVAYTLQMVGQKMTQPTVASLIMSLESVFAVVAGIIVLGEHHTVFEYIGCVLVFGAVIVAQLPSKEKAE